MSRRTGLSVSLLSQIERAETSASLSSLYKISAGLQVRIRDLFGEYLAVSGCAVVNFDNGEACALGSRAKQLVSFAVHNSNATVVVSSVMAATTSRADDSVP